MSKQPCLPKRDNYKRHKFSFIVDYQQKNTQNANASTENKNIGIGILGGLIRVNVNKDTNTTSGEKKGPVSVTIFGQTFETNHRHRIKDRIRDRNENRHRHD